MKSTQKNKLQKEKEVHSIGLVSSYRSKRRWMIGPFNCKNGSSHWIICKVFDVKHVIEQQTLRLTNKNKNISVEKVYLMSMTI